MAAMQTHDYLVGPEHHGAAAFVIICPHRCALLLAGAAARPGAAAATGSRLLAARVEPALDDGRDVLPFRRVLWLLALGHVRDEGGAEDERRANRVAEAKVLLCNFLGLGEALSRVGGAVAMEHPEDLEGALPLGDECPQVLCYSLLDEMGPQKCTREWPRPKA